MYKLSFCFEVTVSFLPVCIGHDERCCFSTYNGGGLTVPCVTPCFSTYNGDGLTVPCVTPCFSTYNGGGLTVPCVTPCFSTYNGDGLTVPCVTQPHGVKVQTLLFVCRSFRRDQLPGLVQSDLCQLREVLLDQYVPSSRA